MSKVWAVSHVDWGSCKLRMAFVRACTYRQAIIIGVLNEILSLTPDQLEDYNDLPNGIDEIDEYFIDCDSIVLAMEVPVSNE